MPRLRQFRFLTLALAILLVAPLLWIRPVTAQTEGGFLLTILHVNDTHAHLAEMEERLTIDQKHIWVPIGGFGRLATRVDQIRAKAKNVLLLHGGDVFQGTLYFTKYHGLADVELMNLIGFDAMAVGNHEFDSGPEVLGQFAAQARFPLLSANTDVSHEPTLAGRIQPMIVKEVGGQNIGIIGVTTLATSNISRPGPRVQFAKVVPTLNQWVQRLTAQGVNKIIVLSHLGLETDLEVAAAVPGIDIIVGGHSHTLLGDFSQVGVSTPGPYPMVVTAQSGNKVLIVQAGYWAKCLGQLDIDFNDQGVVTSWAGRPTLIIGDQFQERQDNGQKIAITGEASQTMLKTILSRPELAVVSGKPEIEAKLAQYHRGFEEMERTIVARVTQDLHHDRTIDGSRVAPIVAEAMLWKARSSGQDVIMYLTNAGGVRSSLPAGPLSVSRIYELLPFGNTIFIVRLTGREIKAALEHGVTTNEGATPCLAGARFRLQPHDPSRPGQEKIGRVELKSPNGQWELIKEDRTYLVGTNSYVAKGGDGYAVFKKARDYRYDTGFEEAEAFMEYLKSFSGTIP